jgi:WD40 repeat protein
MTIQSVSEPSSQKADIKPAMNRRIRGFLIVILLCILAWGGYSLAQSFKTCRSMDLWLNLSNCEQVFARSYSPLSISLSRDGRILAVYGAHDNVSVIDLTDESVKTYAPHLPGDITYQGPKYIALTLTSDGRYVAMTGGMQFDPKLLLLQTDSAELAVVKELALPADSNPVHVAFSPDGSMLAATVRSKQDLNDRVVLWHIPDGEQLARLELPGINGALAYAPDGGHLATAFEPRVQIWDISSFKVEKEIKVPSVTALAFSPDGALLAVSSGKVTGGLYTSHVDLFRLEDGLRLHTFPASDEKDNFRFNYGPLAFAPDGSLLAVSSCVHAYFYRVADGSLVTKLDQLWDDNSLAYGDCLTVVQFSPDGKSAYYGWTDGSIVKWRLP